MVKCKYHPGRDSREARSGIALCAQCIGGVEAAVAGVDIHVEPKQCFVWYKCADTWSPIHGTGCAHWVAHQLGIGRGQPLDRCLSGYTYRVRALISGLNEVRLDDVKAGDIYVTPREDHTGLVTSVVWGREQLIALWIRHDSSGQRKVADNEWSFFHKKGKFYRP